MEYQGNNIIFRIASSDAISKFKAVQAHSFLQLTRKELDFNSSTREIVLLEYERLSAWIFKMEKIFQTISNKSAPAVLKTTVVESFKEEIYMIEYVATSYPDTFDELVVKFTRLIHKYSFGIILTRMEQAMESKVDRAFADIVTVVSDYLQHLLVCFHEYNNNIIKHDLPFVCVADFCLSGVDTSSDFVPVSARLKFFEDYLSQDKFVLKNYSSNPDIFAQVERSINPSVTLMPEKIKEDTINSYT